MTGFEFVEVLGMASVTLRVPQSYGDKSFTSHESVELLKSFGKEMKHQASSVAFLQQPEKLWPGWLRIYINTLGSLIYLPQQ